MVSPNDDLRAYLAQTAPAAPVRLRVLRDGQMVEAVVAPAIGVPASQPTTAPAPADGLALLLDRLEPLHGIADALSVAILIESRPTPSIRQSELVLRFGEPATPSPNAPTPAPTAAPASPVQAGPPPASAPAVPPE